MRRRAGSPSPRGSPGTTSSPARWPRSWAGVEALSGIPGSTGATPVQNVGAYGQEVADVVARVRTFDRVDGVQRTFMAADCGFGYRTSRFKAEPWRHLVLDVALQLRLSPTSEPIRYAELARRLGTEVGSRAPLSDVRAAVLELRRAKGMVLDADDHDTWSVGSFFTNPVLTAEAAAALPADAPRFPAPDGRVKTSAAWLIEHSGVRRGHSLGTPARRLHQAHPGADQPRGSVRGRRRRPRRRRPGPGAARRSGSCSSRSRRWSAADSSTT